MARRYSETLPLGTPAPPFALRDTVTGRTVTLEDFASSPVLLVAFICNHCPYVKHILDEFAAMARDFGPRGLAVVALSSNDAAALSRGCTRGNGPDRGAQRLHLPLSV